ncbi:MAG: carbonic anhydrase [Desulfoplanes sp.]|nr:carbonic anhydrase [Desulfoplanes sp.]MDD4649968.1 carbonic anhydrase [Desulfoplanes sp.]
MKRFSTILMILCTFLLLTGSALAAEVPTQRMFTPDEAMTQLKAGNDRFATGHAIHPNQDRQRRLATTAKGQHPFATVIACSDSRVPAALLFDQGIGDIFTIKVAGNVMDVDEIGSVEYGVDHLGTPVMVVLGHTHCGAVTAVVQDAELHGSIPQLVDNILPAVKKTRHDHPELTGDALVTAAVTNNVWQSISDLLMNSPATRARVMNGTLQVVGAVYDIDTGKVDWLGIHPRQADIMAAAGPAVQTHAGTAAEQGMEKAAHGTAAVEKAAHDTDTMEEHDALEIEKQAMPEHEAQSGSSPLWFIFFLLVIILAAVFMKTRAKKSE